jgi:hypothetical protein
VRELVESAITLTRQLMREQIAGQVAQVVEDRILSSLCGESASKDTLEAFRETYRYYSCCLHLMACSLRPGSSVQERSSGRPHGGGGGAQRWLLRPRLWGRWRGGYSGADRAPLASHGQQAGAAGLGWAEKLWHPSVTSCASMGTTCEELHAFCIDGACWSGAQFFGRRLMLHWLRDSSIRDIQQQQHLFLRQHRLQHTSADDVSCAPWSVPRGKGRLRGTPGCCKQVRCSTNMNSSNVLVPLPLPLPAPAAFALSLGPAACFFAVISPAQPLVI